MTSNKLSVLQLQHAYNRLVKLKNTIVDEEDDEENDSTVPNLEDFEQEVDTVLALLRSKLSLTYSNMSKEDWAKMKITCTGFIDLKPNLEERVAVTASIGQDKLWSSANLYRQLYLLESATPTRTEASVREWIDALFFRASAMLPQNKRMILHMEHPVPGSTLSSSRLSGTFSGLVDYTAIVTSGTHADIVLEDGPLDALKTYISSCFFVIEAKRFNPTDQVSQAVYQMYECGKLLQKKVVRGALTNGRDWIFLLIKLNDDYDGASYQQSQVMELITTKGLDGRPVISGSDLIAGILSYWIENSFVDLGSDDWFELV